jgi:hypothetical protein
MESKIKELEEKIALHKTCMGILQEKLSALTKKKIDYDLQLENLELELVDLKLRQNLTYPIYIVFQNKFKKFSHNGAKDYILRVIDVSETEITMKLDNSYTSIIYNLESGEQISKEFKIKEIEKIDPILAITIFRNWLQEKRND